MKKIETHADWLRARQKCLGASDAAAAVGLSHWKSNVQLWREKTGRDTAPDIANKPCVQFGVACEPHIRAITAELLKPSGIDVSYGGAFDMVARAEEPWYMATLDGRLTASDGAQGVLEIKTGEIQSRQHAEQWDGRIPDTYLCQILHQMNASGWRYAILVALIKDTRTALGPNAVATIRQYEFRYEDYADQAEWLLAKEREFWRFVETDTEPPLALPQL